MRSAFGRVLTVAHLIGNDFWNLEKKSGRNRTETISETVSCHDAATFPNTRRSLFPVG